MIRNYKYRIGEHSFTFNTGESQLGRWYSRQMEESLFKMKTEKSKKPHPKSIKNQC